MTTEIVVMNKVAVSMAADSAVTVRLPDGVKIYNSANKLFALTHHCPIGVMIYGSAEFMEMPWTTLVKLYRDHLGDKGFDTLEEYAQDFIKFLQENALSLFPEDHQIEYFKASVKGYLDLIKSHIAKTLAQQVEQLGKGEQIDDKQRDKVIQTIIDIHHKGLKATKDLPTPTSHANDMMSKYGNLITDMIKEEFSEVPLKAIGIQKLKEIAVWLTSKDIFSTSYSGIVFAGFGQKEVFPSMIAFRVEFLINNCLKHAEEEHEKISFHSPVAIRAFAQGDIVNMFMEGIHHKYKEKLWDYISPIFQTYPEIVVNEIPELTEERKQSLLETLNKAGRKMLEDLASEMTDFQLKQYVEPVVTNVSILPADELAAMAESLVNITSFKRRVSSQDETVGGPIDVAVITKKDGFIWIKRKHYFDPELNRDYFATKFD